MISLNDSPCQFTISVSGFNGNFPPNGEWRISAPEEKGVLFGHFLVSLKRNDQLWSLEIRRQCCGGRLTLEATGEFKDGDEFFVVHGIGRFSGRNGSGMVKINKPQE
jgi:hypothetical protein